MTWPGLITEYSELFEDFVQQKKNEFARRRKWAEETMKR